MLSKGPECVADLWGAKFGERKANRHRKNDGKERGRKGEETLTD